MDHHKLTPQDIDQLLEDFQSGNQSLQIKWLNSSFSLLSLILSSILRKDLPLSSKTSLLIFLEQHIKALISPSPQSPSPNTQSPTSNLNPQIIERALIQIIDTCRNIIQTPIDTSSFASTSSFSVSLKEQILVTTTSVVIVLDGLKHAVADVEGLVELLLNIMNRPNHGVDRGTRGVACECLRELERAYPCLLGEVVSHLLMLCVGERTHACQGYVLLLMHVVYDCVVSSSRTSKPFVIGGSGSSSGGNVPLVPFNVPAAVVVAAASGGSRNSEYLVANLGKKSGVVRTSRAGDTGGGVSGVTTSSVGGMNNGAVGMGKHKMLLSDSNELRRVMSFLLERPQVLTPSGTMEFMSMMIPVAEMIELQPTLLKVQFSGLMYSYDPMLMHVVLMLYTRFLDAFEGQKEEIARRLLLISKEVQQPLVFRLIFVHWLMGFSKMFGVKRGGDKRNEVVCTRSSLYPNLFDPLALKCMKLDLIAYCGLGVNNLRLKDSENSVEKLFEDGLVSVSAFKWLPPWSTETSVAFRMFHKFLIGDSTHSSSSGSDIPALMDSTIFCNVQKMLVNLTLEYPRLVPVVVYLIERLLKCSSHCWLGERLLQAFDQHLLPKIITDDRLVPYFPIFELIAGNETIPPGGLLELLTQFVISLTEKHGPETGMKSWSHGTRVLGICRNMLMHHHSSRVFLGLSKLLTFTCLYFPDLEIRDNARIYLRMLVCIPGRKLKQILNLEQQLPGISPSPHSSTFNVQAPNPAQDLKKSRSISSYIHFERVTLPLVKQSWSLSISMLGLGSSKPSYLEPIRDTGASIKIEKDAEVVTVHSQEPLRVMDSKVSEILMILRRHFSCIPDFRHMSGIKIRLPCTLWFESDAFNHVWGGGELPAIYATVLTFSSSSSYGKIPSSRIAFLLGEPSGTKGSISLDIVPVGNVTEEKEGGKFRTPVIVELEPRAPMPGLIDVSIEANAENGQIISGHLQNIAVGIEDMFLRAIIPSDISEDRIPQYNSDLFDALWEACGSSSKTGRETFSLRGGQGVAAISGTQTVKLLEISANSLINAVEGYLAAFVVSVVGDSLVSILKDGGIIKDIIWKDEMNSATERNLENPSLMDTAFGMGPLQLKYMDDEHDRENHNDIRKRIMGSLSILIFLPPRFHLLFQLEIHEISTLVRIRTDHWPCLAYIDDYLEALFLT